MSRPLRLLTIGHSYVVRLNRAVMARLARDERFDVTIAAPWAFQGDLRPLRLEASQGERSRLVGLPARMSRYVHVFQYGGLNRLIQKGRFDVVHAWEEPYIVAGYQIAHAAANAGSRFVFRTAQSIPKDYWAPFRQFESYCLEQASGWIAGGHLVRQALLERGYPSSHSRVITLGVDGEAFRPDPGDRRALRAELGLEGPVIGFAGRLTQAKGLDVLMDALDRLKSPWTLMAIGSGPERATLAEWAKARGWSGRARILLARHDDVPRYMRAMDVLAIPSQTTPAWKEQFGRVAVEAFGCGLPVVSSDSGELPHLVDGVGEVVPEADPDAWAEALGRVIESPGYRQALATAARERFFERYEVSRVAEQYADYFLGLRDGDARSSVEAMAPAVASVA